MKNAKLLQGAWVASAEDRSLANYDTERQTVLEIVQGALERFDWTQHPQSKSEFEFINDTASTMADHAVDWLSDGAVERQYSPITSRQLKAARALICGHNPDETTKKLLGHVGRGSVKKRGKLQTRVDSVVRTGINSSVQEAAWTLDALYNVAVDKSEEIDISPAELTLNSFRLILEMARLNKYSDPAVIRAMSGQVASKNIVYAGLRFDSSQFTIEECSRGPMLTTKVDIPDHDTYRIKTPGCPAQHNRGILLFSQYIVHNIARIRADGYSEIV